MSESPEILKLRVLLCFLSNDEKSHKVTEIAKTLGEEKYTITRVMTFLEKEGLVDRSEKRNPKLTPKGIEKVKFYEERINITLNHLTFEGVDISSAQHDALHWALYSSDNAMQVIRSTEERYKVKYELRDKKQFSGSRLCKIMRDGVNYFPFVFYREHINNGNNISMANNGFENPCLLKVESGEGTIQIRAVKLNAKSAFNGETISGRVQEMEYFMNGTFVRAEKNGNIFSFPANALNFINIGTGVGQILHGSVCLRVQCSAGTLHMPDSTAIFTIMI